MKKFSNLFPQAQAEFKAQTAELEAHVSQKNLHPLPAGKLFALSNKIDSLSTPPAYREAVNVKLSEAITLWQEENSTNSLIVLGSPIEPFARLFKQIVADWQEKETLQLQWLSWSHRPENSLNIKSQLAQELNFLQDSNSDNSVPILVIIPDLTWCFLRCVHGLDALEYLQNLLFKNASVFWLIGCNTWTWEYLDVVFNFRGYFPQTLYLPELKDINLKEWLTPVSDTIEFEFSHKKEEKEELEEKEEDNWESASQKSYFEYLAQISLGMSYVAARLWLLSLGMEEEEKQSDEDEDSDKKEQHESTQKIILQKIVLPNLPSLTKDDRYLLFSLCLHGQITLSDLAISLGEEIITVQNQVQNLLQAGVIEQKNNLLQINSVYYPQLKKDLTNNNFLIKGDR